MKATDNITKYLFFIRSPNADVWIIPPEAKKTPGLILQTG